MGRPYVMDFVYDFQRRKNERDAKVMYFAECLRMTANNSAMGEERYTIEQSLYDILHPVKETRTADEIINSIKESLKSIGA